MSGGDRPTRINGEGMMNIVLWVLQGLLALGFFAHGWLFLFPPADMVELINAAVSPPFRIFIAVAEVLAAIGLILPGITHVLPWLIPSAAAGLMIVMAGATIFHIARGEVASALTTTLLLLIATFVAYMRWKVMPIQPRGVPAATARP
jgi:putative oxidoreductase